MIGMPTMEIPKIDRHVVDGEIIKLGNSEIKVIHTPGHTQGGVCFYTEGSLFSGDTIFRESVGRCDLPGGDFNQIVDSIEQKVFELPDETVIYPGHGKTTTVGWEKVHNSFM
jgi:glyoxylase-like metal-dependent hydrolase (beta-lactamase superfamily II)